jgi:hypothetical protein
MNTERMLELLVKDYYIMDYITCDYYTYLTASLKEKITRAYAICLNKRKIRDILERL